MATLEGRTELVKRLIALLVPKGLHLTNFHGLLAPAAPARPTVLPPTQAARPGSTSVPKEKKQNKQPRIDWATLLHRTFACDVFKCPCGGQRRVVALVTNRRTAEEMLRNVGMLDVAPPLPQAPGPPQLELLQ
jgi:hypothetical protein